MKRYIALVLICALYLVGCGEVQSVSLSIRNHCVKEYEAGRDGIKGNVSVEELTSISEDFSVGADKDGYAVFKDPKKAFTKLSELYSDATTLIKTEFDLEPLSENDYEAYKIYGPQMTIGTAEEQAKALFVGKFLDIYENSFVER